MNRLINTSLALVLVSALGLAATGSAFAEGGQADFDAEMQRAPQSQGSYTAPASPESMHQQRMQYTPRNIEGSSAGVVGVVTLVGDNMIKLVETDTGLTHAIRVTDQQEEALTTGYIINAELQNGRLVSFQEMGVPQDVKEIVYTAERLPDENVLEQPQRYRAF
ncbi:MAG: hypothetical protein F9K51_05345 [Candidatus Dadabacteria bacterium]|jgi:hypothetical protein|nr:MAG: hypothetical protein F9K51_05345 [Candidatus Dadabacteria bacterium]MCL4246380.1 hypothetical protein [Candidatus Dadabacteria bacterium]